MSPIKFLCCVLGISPLLILTADDLSIDIGGQNSTAQEPATETGQYSELEVIKSELSYSVGDLIDLHAAVGDLKDSDSVIYEWRVRPEVKFVRWTDGSKILFGTGHEPTVYTVFLSVSVMSPENHRLYTEVIDIEVSPKTIVGMTTKTMVNTDFAAVVKQLLPSVAVDSNYSREELVLDARNLSAKFFELKTRLDNGQVKGLDDALNEIRKIIDGFENAKKWEPLFVGIGAALEMENKTGSLEQQTNVSITVGSIADGLGQIK
jgi:hypothetical protein